MKALKDNLEEDEIPPQYQFGESSLICLPCFPSITYNLTLLSILGRDYKDYYDGLATEKEYNEEEESSGTPEEGTDEECAQEQDVWYGDSAELQGCVAEFKNDKVHRIMMTSSIRIHGKT